MQKGAEKMQSSLCRDSERGRLRHETAAATGGVGMSREQVDTTQITRLLKVIYFRRNCFCFNCRKELNVRISPLCVNVDKICKEKLLLLGQVWTQEQNISCEALRLKMEKH